LSHGALDERQEEEKEQKTRYQDYFYVKENHLDELRNPHPLGGVTGTG
jgi:hypothetical protein